MLRTTIVCDHSFVPSLIGQSCVVDCGANRGQFAAWMSANTRATVHSFEPDPRLFRALPRKERVTYHNLAIAAEAGKVQLHLGERQCSSLLYAEPGGGETATVDAVPLDVFLDEQGVGEIGLLKMDIEGVELDVLNAVSVSFLRRVKQITCEFHEFLDPSSLPRVQATLAHLERAGFFWINFSRSNYGDVLFLNRQFVHVGKREALGLRAVKYWRGGSRLVSRRLSPVLSRLGQRS